MGEKNRELQRAKKEMKRVRNNRAGKNKVRGGEDIPQRFPCSSLLKDTMAWKVFPCNMLDQAAEKNCSPWQRPTLDEGKSLRSKEWQEGAVPHPLVKLLGKEVEELRSEIEPERREKVY